MIPQALEDRNNVLYKKLVPDSGKCDTLEGETLRAINRIIYRYYNDGDYWYDGYGIETAGPAERFLYLHSPVDVRLELASSYTDGETYEYFLEIILEKIVTHIESVKEYQKNYHDMLEFEPRYECEHDFEN